MTTASSKIGGLTRRQEATVAIGAFTAIGDIPRLREDLTQGLEAGLTISEIKEILIQMYAYAGFPRSLNGLGTFMALLEERRANGISDLTGADPTATIAALSALDGAESQLGSHLRIALNTGLTEADLRSLVTVLRTRVGQAPGDRADAALDKVLATAKG
ncbi:carboxymuconolactone decarboxylase family protein [Actinoplanes sp. CA-030573]|uniref:carboxymuconolactone decarboxylase family protein n=1 Tax=Actinoplanes sp. CA-030573 TaxID=3239898 RepID=UPI003D937B33